MQGLVWNALRQTRVEVPEDQARELAGDASRIAMQNLQLAAESMRLKADFASADVPVLFIKGLTLAARVYGTLSFKMGWDIDILVPQECAEAAAERLKEAGYRLVIPKASSAPGQIKRWHDRFKESVWRHDERQIHVELHTDLIDNRMLLRGLSPFAAVQEVEVAPGLSLTTLSDDQLFAYLSVHGASSAWFRLKWVADFAAFIEGYEASQIEDLYTRSQTMGAGRAPAQALLLCAYLFGSRIGSKLESELKSDPANLWLFHAALRAMAGPSVATELETIRFGTATIHLAQFGLLPDWRFKIRELWRQIDAMRPRLT